MKIADTAQARKVVQPVKPQPSKQARGVSDFPTDANAPNPVLPPSSEKTPTKPVTPPKTSTPTTDSSQEPMTFDQFLAAMGLTPPPQPSQDDLNTMIQQALDAQLKPVLDLYNQQLGQLQTQNKDQQTFENTLAQQLGSFLSSLGDPNFTPTMAALLGQGAERTSNYNNYQSQQDLWNSLIGGSSGLMAQMPSLRDQITQQIQSQYAGPSSSDLLSAFNAFNDYQNTQFNQSEKLSADAAAQQKAALAAQAVKAQLWKSYEGSYVTDPQTAQLLGVKVGAYIPPASKPPGTASTGTWKVDKSLSAGNGRVTLVNSKTGKQRVTQVPYNTNQPGAVSPSLSAQAHIAVDSRGNPVLIGGRTVPWVTSTSSKKGKTLSAASVGAFLRSLKKTVSAGTTSRLNADGSRTSTPKTKTVYRMTFPQALKYLRSNGVSDKQARSYLDAIYARGQGGRAWLTNEEQAVLRAVARKQAGPADAHLTRVFKNPKTGRAFLSQLQYQVLKANRMLPSGKWGTDGAGQRVWYIA